MNATVFLPIGPFLGGPEVPKGPLWWGNKEEGRIKFYFLDPIISIDRELSGGDRAGSEVEPMGWGWGGRKSGRRLR